MKAYPPYLNCAECGAILELTSSSLSNPTYQHPAESALEAFKPITSCPHAGRSFLPIAFELLEATPLGHAMQHAAEAPILTHHVGRSAPAAPPEPPATPSPLESPQAPRYPLDPHPTPTGGENPARAPVDADIKMAVGNENVARSEILQKKKLAVDQLLTEAHRYSGQRRQQAEDYAADFREAAGRVLDELVEAVVGFTQAGESDYYAEWVKKQVESERVLKLRALARAERAEEQAMEVDVLRAQLAARVAELERDDLRLEIERLGTFYCECCWNGQHEHCAGHDNAAQCVCLENRHEERAAQEEAYRRGVARMKALRQ